MNLKTAIMAAASCCLLFTNSSAFSQGLLTPPGPPGPTMLTLSQIEPRTPIATNTTPGDANDTYIISQPGSYYLTANLAITTNNFGGNAIEILANNVTLDLNGFSVSCASTNTGSAGIYIPNDQTNITVRNGSLTGWSAGVFSLSAFSAGLIFEKLSLANCYKGPGYAAEGIGALGAAVIRDCNFENDYYGISCNGDSTSAMSLIVDCVVADSTMGIFLDGAGVIRGCTVNNCSNTGINHNSGNGGTISGCAANDNYYGIFDDCGRDRIENNHVTGSSYYGIWIAGGGGNTNNIIIGNTVVGSGSANYVISNGQISGPIISTTGTISSTSPWANFSF